MRSCGRLGWPGWGHGAQIQHDLRVIDIARRGHTEQPAPEVGLEGFDLALVRPGA